MGTRALIHVKADRTTIATIYRQLDGYPTGIGAEIKQILNNGDVMLVNGYGYDMENPRVFNGMGCLAAYLVGRLKLNPYGDSKKNTIGNVYMIRPNSKDVGEEFVYVLYNKNDELFIKISETDWDTGSLAKPAKYDGPLNLYIPED